jgi:N-formylglutamate amidohydrolase
MILHIPHASKVIPGTLRDQIVLSDEELAAELLRMTDAFTDELFVCPGTARVVFPISRLLVDAERFVDDASEPMSAVGMGVIYTHTAFAGWLKRELSAGERRRLIADYYEPHHEKLRQAVEAELSFQPQALIVDCHSFPRQPLPCDRDQSVPRPDFCIGTEDLHTPEWLTKTAIQAIKGRGFSVEQNRPYAGSIVPMQFYRKDHRVQSILIEVCRDLYMDEKSGQKNEGFGRMRSALGSILESIRLGVNR